MPVTLRGFQAEIVELAREQNVVMVGDTGIGKTFVAIALLGEQDYSGGRRAFFLAPTRQLVWQITAKIHATSTLRAQAYCGRAMELWGAREWARELATTRVFVCTPEVLRNALERGFVRMAKINLLVFDECHHVSKRHPYAHVIKMYDADRKDEMPRVFGTTACPTRDCAANLHAKLKKVELLAHETAAFAAVAPIEFTTYDKEEQLPAAEDLYGDHTGGDGEVVLRDTADAKVLEILADLHVAELLQKLLTKGRSDAARDEARRDKLVRKFVLACVDIYRNLGLWCLYQYVELEIERAAMNATLLSSAGSMFGFDSAAVKLIMRVRMLRAKCEFAATKRLERVVALLEDRLVDPVEAEEEEDEEASDQDESGGDDGRDDVTSSEASTQVTGISLEGVADAESTATRVGRRLQQGIIFVTTRAECRVLCDFLNEKLGTQDEDDGHDDDDDYDEYVDDDVNSDGGADGEGQKDPRFACILGQASSRDTAAFNLPRMEETLTKFEKGSIQFLVSTAVSIEGVDFPQCSLVVVADRIQAARKLIQLRGRARHEDGVVYYLAEDGDHEHATHFEVMRVEADAINALDFRHDKEETVLQQPRSEAGKNIAGFAFFPDEFRICIDDTGAVLDMDSSVARVNMFCQTLPPQLFTIDYKNMYEFKQEIVAKRPVFRAKLQLPNELEAPPFESKPMHSKATAKAAVAFKACKYLLENGLLDESLNSVYRKTKAPTSVGDLSYFLERLHA